MKKAPSSDRGLRRYVAGLGLMGVVLSGLYAVTTWSGSAGAHLPLAAALTLATLVSAWMPLRFQRSGESQGVTIEESLLVASILVLPASLAPLVAGLAAFIALVLRRQDATKLTFNTGQTLIYATAATATYHLIGAGQSVFTPRSIVAVVAAAGVLNILSLLMFAELFRRLNGDPWSETIGEVWKLYGVTGVGNTAAGILVALLIEVEPAATVLAVTILIGLYLGYRGYAGQLEERRRNEVLHDVTRSLVGTKGTAASLGQFLQNLRDLFSGETAEIVLPGRGERVRVTADGLEVDGQVPDAGPVAGVLRQGSGTRVVSGEGGPAAQLGRAGHRDAIIAPLRIEGWVIGAVAVYDRRGLEPWDDTDLALLASLANEAAVALENVELLSEVERERARLAEESQKLTDVVDAASDGIVMIDAEGRLGTWNQAMVDITGVPLDEALGQPWFVPLRLRDREGNDVLPDGSGPFERAVAGDEPYGAIDLQVLRRDGRWRWLRCTVAPFEHHDEPAGIVVVARDVTSERETEELKSDFVATVSHELRTPLTPIRGGFELLRARRQQMDDTQRDAVEQAIERQLDRLESLVGDLLTVADIDRDDMSLAAEPVDVSGCVLQAVLLEAPDDLRDRVDVDLHDAPRAIGDRAAIERILRALISNALKHTGGEVRIAAARAGDQVHISVSDAGSGIAPRDLERIFQRFGRLGDHLHRSQGPGLGLPIARALATRLGGAVTVRSELGEGSTFTLELPCAGPRPTRIDEAV